MQPAVVAHFGKSFETNPQLKKKVYLESMHGLDLHINDVNRERTSVQYNKENPFF